MAGLCGCQSGCSCLLVGGQGICIEGTGILDDPYVISFCGGTAICDEVMECVAANLMDGLMASTGVPKKIGVKIDPAEDNAAVVGPDGLLVRGQPVLPSPGNCFSTVGGLPPGGSRDLLVWGTYQGGRNVVPYGTFRAYEHAVGLDTHINYEHAYGLCGETAGMAPYATFAETPWTIPTPIAAAFVNVPLNAWKKIVMDVGSYYGMGWSNQNGLSHVTEVLRAFAGKCVHMWEIHSAPHAGLKRNIAQWCVEDATVIVAADVAWLAEVNGVAKGVKVGPDNVGTLTPAAATGAGATWAVLSAGLTDAQIQGYVAAGLSCLLYNTARRSDVDRVLALGMRGVLSDDLSYQANRCRSEHNAGTWGVGTIASGQIHNRLETGNFRNVRGGPYADDDYKDAWQVPSGYGAVGGAPTEDGPFLPAILCGWTGEIPATSYRITYMAKALTASTAVAAKYGMMICTPTDKNPTHLRAERLAKKPQGYVCFVRRAETTAANQRYLTIGYWDGTGSDTSYRELAVKPLPSGAAPSHTVWHNHTIEVTPTTIKFTRFLNGDFSVTVQAARVDPTAGRGQFFHMMKEELDGDVFAAAYRNIRWEEL